MKRNSRYPNPVPVSSRIPLHSVDSSMIDEIGYDAATETVAVRFLSGDLYELYPVAPQTYASFKCDSSKGSFYNEYFRDAPEYTVVKVVQQAAVAQAQPPPAPAGNGDIKNLLARFADSAAALREAQAVYDNLCAALVDRFNP